jgi:hypothetical protein
VFPYLDASVSFVRHRSYRGAGTESSSGRDDKWYEKEPHHLYV